MGKIFDNFIKVTIINKFGGDKKIDVASGKQSKGVIVLSSPLDAKAIDLSRNSPSLRKDMKENKEESRNKSDKVKLLHKN
jgi:hypothetical protein